MGTLDWRAGVTRSGYQLGWITRLDGLVRVSNWTLKRSVVSPASAVPAVLAVACPSVPLVRGHDGGSPPRPLPALAGSPPLPCPALAARPPLPPMGGHSG